MFGNEATAPSRFIGTGTVRRTENPRTMRHGTHTISTSIASERQGPDSHAARHAWQQGRQPTSGLFIILALTATMIMDSDMSIGPAAGLST